MVKKRSAAQYIKRHDDEMRIILGELAENVVSANRHWTHASLLAERSPEAALQHLADAWVALHTLLPVERRDALRRINRASHLLDAELPDVADSGR